MATRATHTLLRPTLRRDGESHARTHALTSDKGHTHTHTHSYTRISKWLPHDNKILSLPRARHCTKHTHKKQMHTQNMEKRSPKARPKPKTRAREREESSLSVKTEQPHGPAVMVGCGRVMAASTSGSALRRRAPSGRGAASAACGGAAGASAAAAGAARQGGGGWRG